MTLRNCNSFLIEVTHFLVVCPLQLSLGRVFPVSIQRYVTTPSSVCWVLFSNSPQVNRRIFAKILTLRPFTRRLGPLAAFVYSLFSPNKTRHPAVLRSGEYGACSLMTLARIHSFQHKYTESYHTNLKTRSLYYLTSQGKPHNSNQSSPNKPTSS